MNRRDLFLVGGAAALLASGCTPQQVSDVEKQVANMIQQVQAGVVAACSVAGKLVPTANTVFQVLVSLLGSTNIVLATAAMVAQAITEIASAGCGPVQPPTAAMKTSKGIDIAFY